MVTGDFRKLYREAWHRLFQLVMRRNGLLRRLDRMVAPAMNLTPATGIVVEFDTDKARLLLAVIDGLTPRITAGVEEVNRYTGADECTHGTVAKLARR